MIDYKRIFYTLSGKIYFYFQFQIHGMDDMQVEAEKLMLPELENDYIITVNIIYINFCL